MCIHGRIRFGLFLKIKYKNEKGEVREVNTAVYRDLEGPDITKEVELGSILSVLNGKKIEVLKIDREFKQLGGYK